MRTTFAFHVAISWKSAGAMWSPVDVHSSDGRSTPWKMWARPSVVQTVLPLT